jgi:hypothetical protein
MAAVPIYVWNGTAWQETGPTIPASPIKYQASAPSSPSTGDIWVDSDGDVTSGSQQFQRFRFVASGGETTISGADANGAVLAYTAGLEQVVLNGAVLVRGHDYTATNGTTITGLSPALVASDVLEVFSFIAFSVANTYTQSQVDGLLTSTPGINLVVPTSVSTGTISSTGAVTFTGAGTISVSGAFSSTYNNYRIVFQPTANTTQCNIQFRLRTGSTDAASSYYFGLQGINYSGTSVNELGNNVNQIRMGEFNATFPRAQVYVIDLFEPFLVCDTKFKIDASNIDSGNAVGSKTGLGLHLGATSFDGFSLIPSSTTSFAGTIRVYGYKN